MALDRAVIDRTLGSPSGEAAYGVCERLLDAGFTALFVGGCVRDMLQGSPPQDIDIATDALPGDVAKTFAGADGADASLGSMRVAWKGHTFEVTTFRADDPQSDGRRPACVTFGDFEADARRRDFTVNALYFNPVSRELLDPFGGEADLRERLIRFIGDPEKRIAEDALRVLRAVRFRALLAGQYHPETYAALKRGAGRVASLSGARIGQEWEKMLLGPRPATALEDLWELDILERIAPELNVCKGIPQPADYHREGDVWEHLLACTRKFRDGDSADVRWAALLHDIGKAETFSLQERIRFDRHAAVSADKASALLQRLQFPSSRVRKIAWLIAHHMMMGAFADMPDDRKGHWYYHPWFPELLRLMQLDIEGTEPSDFSLYDAIVRGCNAYLDAHPLPAKPLLSGHDIMEALGVPPGEEVGRLLAFVRSAQLNGEIASKEEALALLRRAPARPA